MIASALRRPPFRVPPTKPPTSFISSLRGLLSALYSARVSCVLVTAWSLCAKVLHITSSFFQLTDLRELPVAIVIGPSYLILLNRLPPVQCRRF